MDDLQKTLQASFLEESADILEGLEQAFLKLEQDRSNADIVNTIFRYAHNLKGSSRAVGFNEIGVFTHDIESLLLKIKNREMELTSAIFDLLLVCNDELFDMISGIKEGNTRAASSDISKLIQDAIAGKLEQKVKKDEEDLAAGFLIFEEPKSYAEEPVTLAQEQSVQEQEQPVLELASENKMPKQAIENKNTKNAQPSSERKAQTGEDSIRVSLQRADSLVNMIGELVILQTVLSQQRHLIESTLLQGTISQLGKITREIQNTAMSLRMVPLKQTFQKMLRIVRDTSKALGKDIDIEVHGEQTELDKTVVDQLGDPLVHLIRNSCDHGIEDKETRLKEGKNSKGKIVLSARHQGGRIIIEVSDDGRGLNAQALKDKAIEKGIVKANQGLTEQDCYNLIFAPGFSTKVEVSEISGRGVGMDVVKTNIEKILKGEVQLTTVPGKGTTILVSLPVTLAIIDAVVVRCGAEKYVLPLDQIHESVKPKNVDLHHVVGLGEILLIRGENLPLFRLATQMGIKSGDKSVEETALVVRNSKQSFAVCVDEIVSRQQVVIKKLGSESRKMQGITGGAVLGDGTAALILDLNQLINAKKFSKGVSA